MKKRDDSEPTDDAPQPGDSPTRSDGRQRVIQQYIDDLRDVLRKLRRMLN
jgi:hypothetical protein